MHRTRTAPRPEPRQWTRPSLEFKGTVADILKSGGGKLSISAADPGEMRCEKPHQDQCV